MKEKIIKIFALMICVATLFSLNAAAAEYPNYQSKSQYYSYEYNAYDELSEAPNGYYPVSTVYFDNLPLDMSGSKLTDIFYDEKDIYLLDSANSRIIILNKDLSYKSVLNHTDISLGEFEGTDLSFVGARGIYVEDNGQILICDTEHQRILLVKDNVLTGIISRPQTTVIAEDIKFDVTKVIRTGANYYVVAESIVSGVLVFNEELEFVKLFGSNKVAVTGEVLLQQIQNLYMTDEQIAARRSFSASKINGIDIDRKGFVVVASSDPDLTLAGSAIRCLNFKGGEITIGQGSKKFGDKLIVKGTANAFSDIAVDESNFYVVFDSKYGRVFVYSEKGVLITCFGGIGSEMGLFTTPIAIETIGSVIVVLDSQYNSVTVFKLTDYGRIKRELISIIDGGDFEKIGVLANRLLKYNTNCQYAHYAMGFVAEQAGDYKTAMSFYKSANDRTSYGQAFKLYRTQFLKDNVLWVLLIAIVIIVALAMGISYIAKGLKKPEGAVYAPLEAKKSGFAIYCLFHPADSFWQIKQRKILSPVWLAIVLGLFVYTNVVGFFTNGFIHNMNRAQDFNVIIELAKTFGLITVFVVANWAICTITDGKGKPMEILYTAAYSLIPYVTAQIIKMVLTHILTGEETIIISIITGIGLIWSGLVMFVGLLTIHEYSVGKAVFSVLLTIFGMLVILLLIVMFYTLMGQTLSFVQSIIQEYSLQH